MGASVTVDLKEFTATLRKYAELSKRDPALICNTKAFIITRKAIYKMPKATKVQIKEDLMAKGRNGAPIAALLVNKARRAEGLKGLAGTAMAKAVAALIKARKIATLRGGNVDILKALAPHIDKNVTTGLERTTQGKPKGFATPAKVGFWVCQTLMQSIAGAKWDTRDTATPKATPAWQSAFNEEASSMEDYIFKKLTGTARKAGIKTN